MQNTNLRNFINKLLAPLKVYFITSWRTKSIFFISLLLGFYLTNNILSYLVDRNLNSVIIVICIVFIMEVLVKIRYNIKSNSLGLIIRILDNIRIGSSYALILEAFKLGS